VRATGSLFEEERRRDKTRGEERRGEETRGERAMLRLPELRRTDLCR